MLSTAKRVVNRIIGNPEQTVTTITTETYLKGIVKDPRHGAVKYLISLFPIFGWITRYNLGWLTGDLIAGLTVGMVLVPQGMSYAILASLPAQYGLYSSFVGVLVYCFFATSKDVSIGPVAVMSQTVAQIIIAVDAQYPGKWAGPLIATTLAFVCGFIVLGIGLLRIGWIVEFIPVPAVSGYMTGSAINIVAGQVPALMGITGFSTRAATYEVIINTLKGLPGTKLDAAWGLTGLFSLYAIRIMCDHLSKRYPRRARLFFFISVARNAFVVIVLTLASWLYCRHRKTASGKYPIAILETVPAGFQNVGAPVIDSELVKALGPQIPVATIILLLEHIAIARSFGRVNGYKINPNQELIAIGVTNTLGTIFHAYPATGSFSRSALKSKSGVRTPLAGIFTAMVVIVALYGLTPAFYWIPSAGLSAVIIHAVADLVASPSQAFSYWRVSPLEFLIWLAAVLVTIFSSIENGIYTSISASFALLLVRVAHPRGYFLGKVTLTRNSTESREVFVPLRKDDVTNQYVKVDPPTPGVIVYRFEESYLYPNCAIINSVIMADRPWNDPGPTRGNSLSAEAANNEKPALHAIVLDFSGVSQIDTTSVQALVDTRNEVQKWADRPVEFHFATILSPWIRRALVAAGFGIGTPAVELLTKLHLFVGVEDIEAHSESVPPTSGTVPIVPVETPFFHFDLTSAVRAAEAGVEKLHERAETPPAKYI
ncbi:sulfate transporter family-domain-containing protein [Suillus fuscotomentosus]|uniref:Sulfate transporter family-domain-containing protein n=1 Tax=Suillus fuscotomentosus TaxID=1912939 RepID=A0AAD4EDD6_9AGAM|nr:sulfate transporter family-domain-containing protein [Suillus fuscotomentosus]KAG1903932.1 sulfate transporter family-domain-containing protein [Suillus fuscotomentosus]